MAATSSGALDGGAIVPAEVDLPVPPQRDLPPLEHQRVRRGKLAHALERRSRQRNESECEVVVEGRHVEVERAAPVRQQGLDLGSKEELPSRAIEAIVERLDPEPVPRHEQPPVIRLPERECEHALEPCDARLSPFRVGAQDHLGVGGRPEAMALLLERLPQLPVVVNLSVVDDREARALEVHRLAPGGREVDDAQARVGHP